jgi:hypothetical protein
MRCCSNLHGVKRVNKNNLLYAGLIIGIFLISGCAVKANPNDLALSSNALPEVSSPVIDKSIIQESDRLSRLMYQQVPNKGIIISAESDKRWIDLARQQLMEKGEHITSPQLVVLVDRNTKVQEMRLALAVNDNVWFIIGGTKVSTGTTGHFDKYITPLGIYHHTADILDFRAAGTKNENGIRGYGARGMRIWDLGWFNAVKGWRHDGETGEIRLQMHATDPDILEPKMGTPASAGCIRIPAALNRFLDLNGVIDADYERAAIIDARYQDILLRDRTPSPLAGNMIIVVDSSVQ